jgi:hypothetical protein
MKIDDELKENAKPLRERAREVERKWRDARGLTAGMNRVGNAKAGKRRKRAECPKEPKASTRHRRWREKKLGKLGPASKVRRIDPATGEVCQESKDRGRAS